MLLLFFFTPIFVLMKTNQILVATLAAFILLTGITGCKFRNKKNVQYGFKGCFRLTGDEQNASIKQENVDYFANCCYMDTINPMLNRYITAGEYTSFISLIVLRTPKEIQKSAIESAGYTSLASKDFGTDRTLYFTSILQKGDYYLCRTLFSEYRRNIVVMYDIVSEDKSVVEEF